MDQNENTENPGSLPSVAQLSLLKGFTKLCTCSPDALCCLLIAVQQICARVIRYSNLYMSGRTVTSVSSDGFSLYGRVYSANGWRFIVSDSPDYTHPLTSYVSLRLTRITTFCKSILYPLSHWGQIICCALYS